MLKKFRLTMQSTWFTYKNQFLYRRNFYWWWKYSVDVIAKMKWEKWVVNIYNEAKIFQIFCFCFWCIFPMFVSFNSQLNKNIVLENHVEFTWASFIPFTELFALNEPVPIGNTIYNLQGKTKRHPWFIHSDALPV